MTRTIFRGIWRGGFVLFVAGVAFLLPSASFARTWTPEYEKQIGQQALEQIKKEYKLWDNAEALKRVQDLVNAIRAVTPRPEIEYQVYLLDTKEENAFSLPGGYVCVTKALNEAVESDAELAGVLAHEIAHNCTYDALNEAHRAQELTLPVLAAVIATMLTGRNTAAAGNVMTAGMVITQGILSTYSIEVESRADANAMAYLLQLRKYNPVGMLTFMERLAVQERSRPAINPGIYQTHPFSTDRVDAIHALLVAAGVEVNRRAVTKWDPPKIDAGKVGDQEAKVLSLWGQPLLSFNWAPSGTTTDDRGQAMVVKLTELLADGVEGWEFATVKQGDQAVIQARGQDVLRVYPEDARLSGKTVGELAQAAERGLDSAFFKERLKRRY